MTNKPLQEVLYMVLVAGNFLNAVSNFTLKQIFCISKTNAEVVVA